MAMTIQERRKRDRTKKAAQRAAARAAGVPPHHAVLKAIVEANAYALAGVNIGKGQGDRPDTIIDVVVIMRAAVAILTERAGFDRSASERAVATVLKRRPEHRAVGYVPSLSSYPHPVPTVDKVAG